MARLVLLPNLTLGIQSEERFRGKIIEDLSFLPIPTRRRNRIMPMSFCSPDDLGLLDEIEQAGALTPFDETRFQRYQACGICSDGSRFHMKGFFPALCQQNGGGDSMSFDYKTHGTAMCFGLESPLSPDDIWWRAYLPKFRHAQEVAEGRINQFNFVHHWPCRAALDEGIRLEHSILLALMSKTRLKRTRIFREVAVLLWIDIAPGQHELKRVKIDPFIRWMMAHRPGLIPLWQRHDELLAIEAPASDLRAA